MRSSSTEQPRRPVLTVSLRATDRAGWVRLVVAVLLGLVAAAGPAFGSTAAQFTGTDHATIGVTTSDDFGGGTEPQEAAAPTSGSAFLTPDRPHWHPQRPWRR